VKKFNNDGTQGFVVRDDNRKEIIVAFRGTLEIADALVDLLVIMTPLETTGVVDVGDSKVHTGFLFAYSVIASIVLNTIKAQLSAYPFYKIVVAGRSLGGAVASIAAIQSRQRSRTRHSSFTRTNRKCGVCSSSREQD